MINNGFIRFCRYNFFITLGIILLISGGIRIYCYKDLLHRKWTYSTR